MKTDQIGKRGLSRILPLLYTRRKHYTQWKSTKIENVDCP